MSTDLLAAAQFIMRGIDSGHIKCSPYIDDDPEAESLEVKSPATLLRGAIDAALKTEAPAKFEIRVAGPDDVIDVEGELHALRQANSINLTYIADRLAHPNDEVLCVATVHAR